MKRSSKTSQTSPTGKKRQARSEPTTQPGVVPAPPDDILSFSVICSPWTGASLDDLQRLSLKNVKEFIPSEEKRRQVSQRLRELGFDVFESPGPVLTGHASVRLFSEVFAVSIVKRTQKTRTADSRRSITHTFFEIADSDGVVSPQAVPGALLITVAEPPTPAVPSLPPIVPGRKLRLPGDVAQVMRASATHRRPMISGDRATGGGVTVLVVDTGFARHPYLDDHGYRVHRIAASDATNPDPEVDPGKHGAAMLAGLFACAPDVEALAVKYGLNPVTAFNEALALGAGFKVCSLSWGWDLEGKKKLPDAPKKHKALELTLLTLISSGVTVIAAAGNGNVYFPAMMPDVIAVGGVTVDEDDAILAWDGSSSFESLIYTNREVPDVCGIAAEMVIPFRLPAADPDWEGIEGGTSMATAQVAGVAALLLQKKPTLTPASIREHLMCTAKDVEDGVTAMGNYAKKGRDLATGAGLVDALKAWNSVV